MEWSTSTIVFKTGITEKQSAANKNKKTLKEEFQAKELGKVKGFLEIFVAGTEIN